MPLNCSRVTCRLGVVHLVASCCPFLLRWCTGLSWSFQCFLIWSYQQQASGSHRNQLLVMKPLERRIGWSFKEPLGNCLVKDWRAIFLGVCFVMFSVFSMFFWISKQILPQNESRPIKMINSASPTGKQRLSRHPARFWIVPWSNMNEGRPPFQVASRGSTHGVNWAMQPF